MGLEITKNNRGYKVISNNSDEKYFDGKSVSEDEVKKLLIEKEIWNFIDKVNKIEMEFPNGYIVNDKIVHTDDFKSHSEWWLKTIKLENCSEIFLNYFANILLRLNINFSISQSIHSDLEIKLNNEFVEDESVKYGNELIKSGAVKDYNRTWIESVFKYCVKSEVAKKYWFEQFKLQK
jgi:hypothetical protein